MLHAAPAAREDPQSFVCEKTVPLVPTEEIVSGALPRLERVTSLITPPSPTAWVKAKDETEREPIGAGAPEPESRSVKLVPLDWLIVSTPLLAPGLAVAKVTLKK